MLLLRCVSGWYEVLYIGQFGALRLSTDSRRDVGRDVAACAAGSPSPDGSHRPSPSCESRCAPAGAVCRSVGNRLAGEAAGNAR